MSEKELKDWFINKLNSCYTVATYDSPNHIYYIYDESYIRNMKLCKLNNKEINLPSKIGDICLFEQDLKNKYLYCDYDEIWCFFKKNYNIDYHKIKIFIQDILKYTIYYDYFISFDNTVDLFELIERSELKIIQNIKI